MSFTSNKFTVLYLLCTNNSDNIITAAYSKMGLPSFFVLLFFCIITVIHVIIVFICFRKDITIEVPYNMKRNFS